MPTCFTAAPSLIRRPVACALVRRRRWVQAAGGRELAWARCAAAAALPPWAPDGAAVGQMGRRVRALMSCVAFQMGGSRACCISSAVRKRNPSGRELTPSASPVIVFRTYAYIYLPIISRSGLLARHKVKGSRSRTNQAVGHRRTFVGTIRVFWIVPDGASLRRCAASRRLTSSCRARLCSCCAHHELPPHLCLAA